MTRFDLDLFRELQEEYRDRPLVPVARGLDAASLAEQARRRVAGLERHVGDFRGARVLDIGCGQGSVARVLQRDYGCDVVGVDIVPAQAWVDDPGPEFYCHDVAAGDNEMLGQFDLIVSFAVWEHVEHPFAALRATRSMLRDDGRMYLYANLHRGPKASHRYREIFFPWPHLLFQDDVIVDYYREDLGRTTSGSSWVNRLTTAHYVSYFDLLDFDVDKLWWSVAAFDEEFYERFADVLGRYPRYDLERDFIHAVVSPRTTQASSGENGEAAEMRRRLERLQARHVAAREEIRQLRSSRSWRVTAPLRAVSRAVDARRSRDGG